MKVNHLNYNIEGYDRIYCHRRLALVRFDQNLFDRNCSDCPYFNGHLQGNGVECLYEDPYVKEDYIAVDDPYKYYEKTARRLRAKYSKEKFVVIPDKKDRK